jgi:hypothetical protein
VIEQECSQIELALAKRSQAIGGHATHKVATSLRINQDPDVVAPDCIFGFENLGLIVEYERSGVTNGFHAGSISAGF